MCDLRFPHAVVNALSKLDVDGFDLPAEGEWYPVEVVKRNRRTEVLSDIESLARREGTRDSALDRNAQRLDVEERSS
jgi:hypothetical protein